MATKGTQLLVPVVVFGVAAILTKFYIDTRVEEYKPKSFKEVAMAKVAVKAGDRISKGQAQPQKIPDKFVPRAAIPWKEFEEQYVGQEAAVDIASGDYLLASQFSSAGEVSSRLSGLVRGKDSRAITIPVDETNSLSRSIVSGDHVDIVFSFSVPGLGQKMTTALIQNVLVLATGSYSVAEREIGGEGARSRKYNAVTLEVSSVDAMRIIYARQAGQISLLLRNNSDSGIEPIPTMTSIEDILSADDKQKLQQVAAQRNKIGGMDEDKFKDQMKAIFDQSRKQGGQPMSR